MERQNILYRLKQGLSLAGILVSIMGFAHASQAAQTFDDKPLPLPTSSTHAPETTAEPTVVDPNIPTPAPTLTTDLYVDLHLNGGFETNGAPLLDPWTIKGHAKDGVVCNSMEEHVTPFGACAFMFKGNTGKDSVLEQTINLNNFNFKKNDRLALWVYARFSSVESIGQVQLIVKYGDHPTDKQIVELEDWIETPRQSYWTFLTDLPLQSDQVREIKIVIIHNRKAPPLYIDDVRLNKTRSQ
jgi:hypothetical protein